MDPTQIPLLSVTPLYAALLGLLFLPITMRAGFYRARTKIFIGDGGDPEMLRRIRGQGNFIETVPIALTLLIVMELTGAGSGWLNALGTLLVFGRLAHYIAITELGPNILRVIGMVCTLTVYLVSSGWILATTL